MKIPFLTRAKSHSSYHVFILGDSVTIASSEELLDACEQYADQKLLRITTNFKKPNTTVAPATAAVRASCKRTMFVETPRTGTNIASQASQKADKRIRMSSKKPQLPLYRLETQGKDHLAVIVGGRKGCTYCKYKRALAKLNDKGTLPSVSKIGRKCLACGDHLCKSHFDVFHKAE